MKEYFRPKEKVLGQGWELGGNESKKYSDYDV